MKVFQLVDATVGLSEMQQVVYSVAKLVEHLVDSKVVPLAVSRVAY